MRGIAERGRDVDILPRRDVAQGEGRTDERQGPARQPADPLDVLVPKPALEKERRDGRCGRPKEQRSQLVPKRVSAGLGASRRRSPFRSAPERRCRGRRREVNRRAPDPVGQIEGGCFLPWDHTEGSSWLVLNSLPSCLTRGQTTTYPLQYRALREISCKRRCGGMTLVDHGRGRP
jgi:hypothetical protein